MRISHLLWHYCRDESSELDLISKRKDLARRQQELERLEEAKRQRMAQVAARRGELPTSIIGNAPPPQSVGGPPPGQVNSGSGVPPPPPSRGEFFGAGGTTPRGAPPPPSHHRYTTTNSFG
ncbi:unnamed protein product [Anisakis simplex]|uniref:GED domain-containing protein n=1 Tax=Anisakis simplex TaxID=6269 RepID=A0A0M3KI00_ANISI|nr:unnamed protein product [Anisakis simplex]